MPATWKSSASAEKRRGRRSVDIEEMLGPDSVRCEVSVGSKKHALDMLSEMLAAAADGPSAADVLEGLAARERLGSTGLGRAVAMPHARVAGLGEGKGAAAFLKLTNPVEFDAPDGGPVDLLLALLLPEAPDTEDAEEIGVLADRLSDPALQRLLRGADEPGLLRRLLVNALGSAEPPAAEGPGR